MPLCGKWNGRADLVVDEAPYFTRLDDLDTWAVGGHKRLTHVLRYYPTIRDTAPASVLGKLLVSALPVAIRERNDRCGTQGLS
jgi:hypothetical protein